AEPRVDFRDWELGRGKAATFDWDHSYGPLDWPREGTALAAMESDRPHYWRAAVLDEFDGVAWQRPEQSFGERLELPTAAEGGAADGSLARDRRRWMEQIGVTVGPIESEFVLSAGAVVSIDGLDSALSLPNGTTVTGDEPLEEGNDYRVLSYAPDPSPGQLRRAPDEYPTALARYTQLTIPARAPADEPLLAATVSETDVQVPLRGAEPASGDRAARRAIASSPYADTYELARRLIAGEPTAYDAAKAIEAHFQSGFSYTEDPGQHRLPLAGFLFEERAGYCQQFSGAMALMLRMTGIPSRVVSGFSPGTPDPDQNDRYLVSDTDAHSWVEAYFPGIGWVTFDPTPPGAPSSGRLEESRLGSLAASPDDSNPGNLRRKGFTPPETPATDPVETGGGGSAFPAWTIPAGIGVVGLIAAVALAALTAVRRYRYERLSPEDRADAHLSELPGALARLGWRVSSAETLLALERRLHRHRKDSAAAYVNKLRTARFSPTPGGRATLADRRVLRHTLAGGNGLGSRIRGLLALPPGGPSG
ncbi:MAG TPA: transglutaminaseTgpA domain-containing protein, partial [Solirubrobacterales bacterium]|nr:transglutaminaseTgpA domain-containing protein [Solirubrobacterales bacterium]